jgi:hypothetical protein
MLLPCSCHACSCHVIAMLLPCSRLALPPPPHHYHGPMLLPCSYLQGVNKLCATIVVVVVVVVILHHFPATEQWGSSSVSDTPREHSSTTTTWMVSTPLTPTTLPTTMMFCNVQPKSTQVIKTASIRNLSLPHEGPPTLKNDAASHCSTIALLLR